MKGIEAVALALLVAGCGAVGEEADRLLVFGQQNFSDHQYSLHARELSFPIPGSAGASLLESCQAGYLEMRLRPPFEVRVGPGTLEQTGDGSGLPVILTDADFPNDGAAWWITVERDGTVGLRPVARGRGPYRHAVALLTSSSPRKPARTMVKGFAGLGANRSETTSVVPA